MFGAGVRRSHLASPWRLVRIRYVLLRYRAARSS